MKELVVVHIEIEPLFVLPIRIVHNEIYLAGSFLRFLWRFVPILRQANRIHSVNNVGAQPLSMKNNASLKVSVSPIGFFQKTACISLGHSFKEKKAFPFRSFNNCLRRSDTSFFERKRISSRYILSAAILLVSLLCSTESDYNSLNSDIYTTIPYKFMSHLNGSCCIIVVQIVGSLNIR